MLEVKLVRVKKNNKPLILVKQGNRVIFLTKRTYELLKKRVEEILPEYEQQKLEWYNKNYESFMKGGKSE